MAPKRYSYSDVKKMTDSFKTRLGQGGYGIVYKGSLPDGRLVAVKILNNNLKEKGMGEEFINEVASISKTSHVNIVSLLGFCFEGDKRALIYEFMANGSLEKFIYNGNTWKVGCCLQWKYLYEVAIGIAKGLEYLHGGCNTRILHLDIKPHNILLDENFHPKIADFGLSKLCSRKECITSMDDARGTIGYIAPEVYSRSFGRVSHKSDVYSYGMLILEMASGRTNANIRIDDASKIYFPHWIYHRLQFENDLGLYSVRTKEEDEIARRLLLVGLWCIQTNPSHRPSMSKVLLMLEACSKELEIPPKPYNISPQNSAGNPSATPV
ncbi:LEAF RUST 10 DISEASE-RESISTANCE LOCUS RECEPTOR-LIKE PROTEIN KINASE-like 2.4 [Hevea brasiliensis]|uniref:LEAF RUST 10 DISEASE-RESISTANCE LOCUS RECEPTOR-LIKE PROTEIN KINASE-like 2.4 n=1 Tax=Hevea brasiliensis TaxID=3981 RepID=UPI0025D4BE39|nr:LEAF RUST 10 DISEASE-RESISTANCE LOCUS RECEPTOR-LIKE PROTEIN KINASE-like 2.4 [Hevea brasiliensis]